MCMDYISEEKKYVKGNKYNVSTVYMCGVVHIEGKEFNTHTRLPPRNQYNKFNVLPELDVPVEENA